jgi:hypothetical protein
MPTVRGMRRAASCKYIVMRRYGRRIFTVARPQRGLHQRILLLDCCLPERHLDESVVMHNLGMRFRAKIQLDGKTSTGIPVPPEVLAALGSGKRIPVRVTVGGHSYRSTVGFMGGQAKIPLSADNRKSANVAAGDEVDVDLELDTEEREVSLPPDLAEAIAQDAGARQFFDSLTASRKREYVTWIEQAKKAETRQDRVEKAAARLRDGQPLR